MSLLSIQLILWVQDKTRGRPGGPSKYRGVIWHKSNCKWEARIYDNGKQRFLGYYTSEEEAARVFDEAAVRIGARTNFPVGECLSRSSSAPAELLDMDMACGGALAPPAPLSAAAPAKGGRLRKKPPSAATSGGNKGSSKYRGVSWNSNCSKWRAQARSSSSQCPGTLQPGPHLPILLLSKDAALMASVQTATVCCAADVFLALIVAYSGRRLD